MRTKVKRVHLKLRESQRLLERMTKEPQQVLEVLRPAERGEVMDKLRELTDRAATVRKGSELMMLADDVLRLVTDRPALEERFPVTLWRTGGQEDIDIMFSDNWVLEHAAQIDNSVAELGKAIEEELQELPERTSDDAH